MKMLHSHWSIRRKILSHGVISPATGLLIFDLPDSIFSIYIFIWTFRPTWVQAEKRGFISRWRDWEGTRLRDILWYEDLEDQGQDEPTAGDKFGYIESESVWGAARTAVQPYYCVYNIDYLCSV